MVQDYPDRPYILRMDEGAREAIREADARLSRGDSSDACRWYLKAVLLSIEALNNEYDAIIVQAKDCRPGEVAELKRRIDQYLGIHLLVNRLREAQGGLDRYLASIRAKDTPAEVVTGIEALQAILTFLNDMELPYRKAGTGVGWRALKEIGSFLESVMNGTAVFSNDVLRQIVEKHEKEGTKGDLEAEIQKVRGAINKLPMNLMPAGYVVITVHGIRTDGNWQKEMVWPMVEAGLRPDPYGYGFFSFRKFVCSGSRDKEFRRFLDYLKNQKHHQPSIIAHSFGTYLVARALEHHATIKFDKIILIGSLVREDYPWKEIINRRKQCNSVLNEMGAEDRWVKLAPFVIPSHVGRSGAKGFEDTADEKVFERRNAIWKHSDAFFQPLWKDIWFPYLRGDADPPSIDQLPSAKWNWRFPVGLLIVLIGILIVAFLGWVLL